MFQIQRPIHIWKVSTLVLAVFLIIIIIVGASFLLKDANNKISDNSNSNPIELALIEPASAQKIYPLFECPCCGKSIDQCTCGMAKERKDYIDSLAETKIFEDEITMAYVKKYGLNSFIDEERQKEFREKLVKEAPVDRPIISLSPNDYDFGDVSQNGGIATTLFELRNEGKNDLIIERLETSCGCTFASIVFKDKESPLFTMPGHGYENPEWKRISIPSGETAQLKVTYDPDVHQDFRGPAIREIYVFSNDPIDFEKKVKIELNQVD